ncbi:MAG: ribosome biogenesis GTP-binding protein YihA/YsxC [Burkholderiales bacterium]|nr:ribosome biogenesis GTP-binding protein YihA/YsxC [Burkholderiales bacterium]
MSVHDLDKLPPEGAVEVAFVGRSNAGKSSAINTLSNRNRLAFVSKTPGRTQLINFFSLGDNRYLVDLPGYGFAGVPIAVKRHWEQLLSSYVGERKSLAGLVLIMDARHPLKPLDQQMLGWFAPTGKPVHVLLTKADKLSRNDALQTLARVKREVAKLGSHASIQLFSSLSKLGVEEAETRIGRIFATPLETEKEKGPGKGDAPGQEQP